MEKAPLLSAVAEPKRIEPLKSFTVLPASAIPVIVGVVSFPREVLVKEEGALGAVVSTVIDKAEDDEEVLPAASVEVVVNEYEPSLRADDVMEKLPLLSAVVEPKRTEPLNSFTVLPASAVPVKVGVVSVVILSVLELPVSELAERSGVDGAEGAIESNSDDVGVALNP